jgi:hypothetical protein
MSAESTHISVLQLCKLNHGNEVRDRQTVHNLLYLAQTGGLGSDPLDESLEDHFSFTVDNNEAYSEAVDEIIDELLDSEKLVETESGIKITADGHSVVKNNVEAITMSDLRALKFVKTLYNVDPDSLSEFDLSN